MLLLLIQLFLPIALVAAYFKLDQGSKPREFISKLFWEDIFYSYENDDKQGIKLFRFYVKAIIIFYLYSNFALLTSAILYMSVMILIITVINIVMIPMMFRFVFGIQKKIWKID